MRTSFQIPPITWPPRAVPLHKAALPSTEFVDCHGDVWVPSGHAPNGELLLTCPQPSNPEDQGEGDSFAWTLGLVRAGFGPLIARSAVRS